MERDLRSIDGGRTSATSSRRPSRVDEVYDRLRDDVCHTRLRPGERLHLAAISRRFDVSLTVVREAVTRLAGDRLLELTPNQGFRVWPLSVEELVDLTRIRVHVERLALSESVATGDLAWEADLVAAHHLLTRTDTRAADSHRSWVRAHAAFHDALAAACTSPLLLQLRRQFFDSAELYRHWSANLGSSDRDVASEHTALLDAALARDAEGTVRLATDHIEATTALLLAAHRTSEGSP